MSKDIIADNQTAAAVSKLRRGEATDALRDEVSAALLTTMQGLVTQLDEIQKHLWSPQDLRLVIDERHQAHCAECPARKWVNAQITAKEAAEITRKVEAERAAAAVAAEKPKHALLELFKSEGVRLFILVLVLVWAVIYIRTGVDGVEAVKDATVRTVSGGLSK